MEGVYAALMKHPVACLSIGRVADQLGSISHSIAFWEISVLKDVLVKLLGILVNVRVFIVVPTVWLNEQWAPSVQIERNL